ncbi:hypothetical protein [Nocardia brasiliensis]|uniref:hypothetical protein n=1 Tax=Nocardia brasiliensis TaxID=37326 RepID=UPI00245729D0|nr:hypothetical protein [Nocardia brasiliensis]
MHVSDAHRSALIGLGTKADQIRYVCEQLGHPETSEVHAWLDTCKVTANRKYVSRVVNEWREERGLTDTGGFPALTDDVLTELDAQAHDETRPDETDQAPAAPAPEAAPMDEATAELAARVASAQARLPLQREAALTALLEVLSEEELAKERALAEEIRETDREIRRATKAAELANARRAQRTADDLAKEASKDARWHRRALAARERLSSPDARLAQLYQRAEWSSRALIAVVILGMVWAGVNVQHNLVPSGDMSEPLYWISYGIEAMISIPIIVIMVAATTAARWGRKLPRGKVIGIEVALLALTVTLNAGPHVFGGERPDWATAGEYAIAPFMIGVVIWLHAWVSNHYAQLIKGADPAVPSPH